MNRDNKLCCYELINTSCIQFERLGQTSQHVLYGCIVYTAPLDGIVTPFVHTMYVYINFTNYKHGKNVNMDL